MNEIQKHFIGDETISDMQCPICRSLLKDVIGMVTCYDGNMVYECLRNEEHRFWTNPRSMDVIYLNRCATQENWDYDRRWLILEDGKYEEHL